MKNIQEATEWLLANVETLKSISTASKDEFDWRMQVAGRKLAKSNDMDEGITFDFTFDLTPYGLEGYTLCFQKEIFARPERERVIDWSWGMMLTPTELVPPDQTSKVWNNDPRVAFTDTFMGGELCAVLIELIFHLFGYDSNSDTVDEVRVSEYKAKQAAGLTN